MEQAKTMPIAITGMACRFPGQADTPERLWEVCASAQNTWSEWPKNRLNEKSFVHPQPEHLGTFHSRGGHFLDQDVSSWDASFFNFTADMAKAMDPQIRLLLETAFEAFQTAGMPLEQVAGSETAVFAGSMFRDYHDLLMRDADNLSRYHVTGNAGAFTANRLSHFFDLRGPSVSVDTACSTTLAALHLACQSLRAGESHMALVGGANLMLHPGSSMSLSNLGLTGPGGKSYSFDSRAQGYGRGEGIACIVLKPLDDAVRDGDPIRAVIRETGMNQDGRTQTITTPSPEAQRQLIRRCYRRAGLEPSDTSYVEAHGTGTIAGDKIELGSLGATIGQGRGSDNPLYVGSIKANIGHTEAASGLAAVIKVALMLEHGQIPPQALFEKHNPRIDFEALNIKIPTELMAWPNDKLRRASISNFGAGGANTHVIIEDPGHLLRQAAAGKVLNGETAQTNGKVLTNDKIATQVQDLAFETPRQMVYTLSARDESSLRNSIRTVSDFLSAPPKATWTSADLAFTMNEKRSHFAWRAAVTASTMPELRQKLSDATLRATNSLRTPRLGFVFTGQGAQWYAMGRELIGSYPVFEGAIDEADKYMKTLGAKWSVRGELARSEKDTRLNDPYLSFPLSVLLQLALVRLLGSWGVTPTAVTGHSSGEISAAYAAGALTFREALAVAYIRGKLTWDFVSSGKARGGMTAVAASREKVAEYFQTAKTGTSVVVACVNSPESVTISGKVDSLKNIENLATADGVMFRRLKVPAAYHSSEMDYLADDYATWLAPHFETSHPRAFTANFSSPVTGGLVANPATIHNPSHWVKNMVQPVLFNDCLPAMIMGNDSPKVKNTSPDVDIILEIGPHGALQGPIRQILDGMKLQSLKPNVGTCLKRGEDAVQKIQETVSMLYCRGCRVDLRKVNFPLEQASPEVVVDLPTYQWNHAVKFWDAPQITTEYNQRAFPPHDLLGARVEGLNPELAVWRNMLRLSDLPWLQHHVVQSEILYPAAGMMSMVTEALRQLDLSQSKTPNGYVLSDIDLINAVIIPNTQDGVEIQLTIRNISSAPDDSKDFVFYSRLRGGNWTRNCQGKVSPAAESPQPMPRKMRGLLPMGISHFYDIVERTGPTLGPTFRNVTELAGGNGGSEAVISIHDTAAMMPATHQSDCVVHPTTLDACFHPAWAALPEAIAHKLGLSVPRTIRNLFININMPSAPGSKLGLTTSIEKASHDEFTVSISVFDFQDPNRVPLIKIDGLKLVSIAPNPGTSPEDELMLLHTVWQPSLNYMSQYDLQKHITEAPRDSEVLVFEELQKATVNVIHDMLGQITPEVEENLHWYHQKYVTWMREQDQAFYAECKVQDEQAKLELYRRVTPSCVNGRMLDLVAKNLLKFLRKEADPLEVMAQGGFLSEYYANMIKLTRCLNHVEKYMKLFAHQNPGARILEIGAGTGSCTEPALKGLSQDRAEAPLMAEKYVFTDVSAGFFETAGKRFAPYASQMHFQKLDIEREPSAQGFVEGEYDLVISCNCLHATSSLKKTMDNVRKLLKPGGKLLLVETTTPHVDQSLTFGLFSGWWLSEEEERKSSPLLSAPAWSRYLAESSFSGVDIALGDAGSPEASNYSAMIATAVESPVTNGYTVGKKVALARFPPSAEVPAEWLQALNDALNDYLEGGEACIVDAGSPLPPDTWCACVLAVGQEPFSSLSPADFDGLKSTLLGAETTLWISRGAALSTTSPAAALATGLLRTLRMEQGADRFTSLDLDPEQDIWQPSTIEAIRDVLRGIIHPADKGAQEYELAHRSGAIMVPRYHRNTALIREARSLQLGEPVDGLSKLDDLRFDPNAAYLVLGGLTGVGRELVRWMASMGAKNIILISRNASQESTRDMQAELREYGCRLIPSRCDIANKRDLKNLIDMCQAFTLIRGVIHSALMLDDSGFANMTHEQWEAPMAAKYHGTRNLDELFRGAADLDFFIMLSSVTGVLGSHGQANYTAGSTYQDALARRRVARGLPGVSIDLGGVLGAGFVARTRGVAERAAKAGWRSHTVAEALRLIELAMRHPRQPELLAGVAGWRAREPEPLPWRHEPRFRGLPIRQTGGAAAGGPKEDGSAASLKDQLRQTDGSAEAAVPVLVGALTVRLAEMFVLSPADINAAQPLSALGVDSLVAVELRNWLSANAVANVTIFDVTQSGSLVELAERVAAKFFQA